MELVLEVADWIKGIARFFNRVMRRLALQWLLYIHFDWKFGGLDWDGRRDFSVESRRDVCMYEAFMVYAKLLVYSDGKSGVRCLVI